MCLNPVYQKTLTIANFRLNAVNRAKPEVIESSAGKGINVARVLKTLGQNPVITGFIGGDTGKAIEQFLSQEGLAYDFVHTSNKTRTCTTILDPLHQSHTELVEEGKPVTSEEVREMYQVYERNLQGCQMVTISGTAPQHVPDDVYEHFVRSARNANIPVLVDTQKNLLKNSLKATPLLVKINKDELGMAFQQTIDSLKTLRNLVQSIHDSGIEWIVLTHGKEDTIISHQGEFWDVIPPSIVAVNPIGSGDAVLAGIASSIMQGYEVLQAIRFGTACGTANALTLTPGHVRAEDIKRLERQVVIKRNA